MTQEKISTCRYPVSCLRAFNTLLVVDICTLHCACSWSYSWVLELFVCLFILWWRQYLAWISHIHGGKVMATCLSGYVERYYLTDNTKEYSLVMWYVCTTLVQKWWLIYMLKWILEKRVHFSLKFNHKVLVTLGGDRHGNSLCVPFHVNNFLCSPQSSCWILIHTHC